MGEYSRQLSRRLRPKIEKVTQASLPPAPDLKGKQDGLCNRTACQAPLAGNEQWSMRVAGYADLRHFYCTICARDFNAWDQRSGKPLRCEIVEETRGMYQGTQLYPSVTA